MLYQNPRRLPAYTSLLVAIAIASGAFDISPLRGLASVLAAPTSTDSSLAHTRFAQKGMLPSYTFPCAETIRPQAGQAQPPTNLIAAGGFSYSQINLSWVPAPGADNAMFGLERRPAGQTQFAQIAKLCGSITSYADSSGLVRGGTYEYRIQAFNSAGAASAYSNIATGLADIPNNATGTAPAQPVWQPLVVVSSIQINLSWTESTSGVDGFFIERKVTGGTFTQIKQLAGSATTYSDTGLSAGITYFYQMRAFNNLTGLSNYSATINGTTLSTPPPPSNLTASAVTAAQINLGWTDNSTGEDGFSVERATGAGAYAQIATVTANLASYQDTDPALLPATVYNYRVRAFSNAAGYSP